MNRNGLRFGLMTVGLMIAALNLGGCHTVYQCPILQGMSNWTIPSPLPMSSDTYDVVGYRDGVRFYVIKYNADLYRSGDMMTPQGADAIKALGIKTIITTSESPEQRAWAGERGMEYLEIPFGWNDMSADDLATFMQYVKTKPKPICVISRTGSLRAGILAACYRVKVEGWPVQTALNEYYRLQANIFDAIPLDQTLRKYVANTAQTMGG